MKLLAIDGNSIMNRAFYGIKMLSNKNINNSFLGRCKTDGDIIGNKLQTVPVTCGDEAPAAVFLGYPCESAEDIISLEAFAFKHSNAHSTENILYHGHLHMKFLGHTFSVSLIACISLMAEGRGFEIESDSGAVGLDLGYRFQVYIHKTCKSVCEHTLFI